MSRGKSSKMKPFEKLLIVMASGKPMTIQELDDALGNDIYMYRISSYFYQIKAGLGAVIKTVKEGRNVISYQLINVDEMKKLMDRTGLSKSSFTPSQTPLEPTRAKVVLAKQKVKAKKSKKVQKLADLSATPVVSQPAPVATDEVVVTEVTDTATVQ